MSVYRLAAYGADGPENSCWDDGTGPLELFLDAGGYRPLNLQIEPINLKQPFLLIDEQTSDEWVSGSDKKMLGVWRIKDL